MEFNPDTFPTVSHVKGPVLIGFIMSIILFGSSVLAFINYLQFSWVSDRLGTRVMALAVATIALMQIVFSLAWNLRTFTTRFGLRPMVDDAKWNCLNYVLGALAHASVAGFFARRAWLMYNRPLYMAVGLTALLATTAVGATGAAVSHVMAPLGTRTHLDIVFNHILLISQMVGDLMISLLIVLKLLTSRTGWKTTDSVIRKLVVIGIETQLPPSIIAIAFLITFVAAPFPTYILAFTFFPQAYVLCFFAALNARYTISAKMSSESSHLRKEKDGELAGRRAPTAINVTTEIYTHAGDDNDFSRKPTAQRGAGTGRLASADSTDSLQDVQDDSKDYNTSEIRLV